MPTYYRNGALWIEIRPRENHPVPHVHVHFQGKSVSIALDGTVLAGGLGSSSQQAKAIAWIIKNRKMLEKEWRRIHHV